MNFHEVSDVALGGRGGGGVAVSLSIAGFDFGVNLLGHSPLEGLWHCVKTHLNARCTYAWITLAIQV